MNYKMVDEKKGQMSLFQYQKKKEIKKGRRKIGSFKELT